MNLQQIVPRNGVRWRQTRELPGSPVGISPAVAGRRRKYNPQQVWLRRGDGGAGRDGAGPTLRARNSSSAARADENELIREARVDACSVRLPCRQYEHQSCACPAPDRQRARRRGYLPGGVPEASGTLATFVSSALFIRGSTDRHQPLPGSTQRKKTRREDHAVVLDHQGRDRSVGFGVGQPVVFKPARELDRKQLGEKIQAALVKLRARTDGV